MNKVIFMFLILLFNTNIYTQESNIRYINADIFPVLGKATENTLTRYERLPDSLQQMISPILWNLGCNSAGLAVRFRSNSSTIAAKWEVREDVTLNIMTSTAIKGLDLYCLNEDGKWLFAGSGHPQGKSNQAILATDMLPKEREFMLYLSLYDGITSLAIGIDSLASIKQPQIDSPKQTKPIVFYGTSIMQGGCASRPGMAHTNILERWFNRECINLGFRGNGLLDPEIAEVMAGVDASLFILDFLPNATAKHVKERADLFYSIIRSKHPDVPILFTETIFVRSTFNEQWKKEIQERNKALQSFFNSLKRRNEKNIYYLSAKDIIGHDGEATVDGVHFTDLGFMRYAEVLYPILKKLIE